ncbi:PAN2-PAN3 deadenylation complex catalytic subunit [Trichinella pseudospiralis]
MFRRYGRATAALNLPVTCLECRSKHTRPGCARSGGIVLHYKKPRPYNGGMSREAIRQLYLGQPSTDCHRDCPPHDV